MVVERKTHSGFMPERVVHLHPTRFCNLSCKHCYSSSNPNIREMLDPKPIVHMLCVLYDEGYNILSVSGGEPLLYPHINKIATEAMAIGYKVNLITNGSPIGHKNLELLSDVINFIAISLDGSPALHTTVRQHQHAFTFVERAINYLNEYNIDFGIAYCVSKLSIEDMPWVADFAEEADAKLLQFHPYAATGRGKNVSDEFALDKSDMARAFLIGSLLENSTSFPIQLDLLPVNQILKHRSRYSILNIEDAENTLLSDIINPVVLTDRGQLMPFTYGMNTQFRIANMNPNLADNLKSYKESRWVQVRNLLHTTFQSLHQTDGFIDWFHYLSQQSYTIRTFA